MKTLFTLALLVSHISFAEAAQCKLPAGEKLLIGCTYKCDFPTRFRLKAAAAKLGYKLKFQDLGQNKNISDILDSVDSIVIPGGADIHPKFYLRDVTPELREYTNQNLHLVKFTEEGKKRDLFEYSLLKLYQASQNKTLPLLGICRGMQMMSVAKGIPLYLDIKTELGIPNRIWKWDRVHLTNEEGVMGQIYRDDSLLGFQLHHQGIRVDYYENHKDEFKNVRVSSYSNDAKIAESIEYTDQTALGVQYHPERSFPRAAFPVFKWFLTKACEHKNARKEQL